jgi:hypothetical protein
MAHVRVGSCVTSIAGPHARCTTVREMREGPFEVGNQVLTSKRTHADEIEMIFPFGGQLTSPSDGVHIGPRFRLFG